MPENRLSIMEGLDNLNEPTAITAVLNTEVEAG